MDKLKLDIQRFAPTPPTSGNLIDEDCLYEYHTQNKTMIDNKVAAKTGDLTNLTTTAQSNLVAAINEVNDLKPVSLYDNSSGIITQVSLSDSSANYSYLEIFFKVDTSDACSSVKVYSPNGKKVNFNVSYDNGTYLYLWNEQATISTNKITRGTQARWRIGTSGNSTRTTGSTVSILVYKVIGYK